MIKLSRPVMTPCVETAAVIAKCQAMIVSSHKLHLKTTGNGSYAAHKALNEFYSQMLDLVDAVAEQYQGAREKLLDIKTDNSCDCSSIPEFISHAKTLYNDIVELQKIMPFSEVTNQLDEIKSVISSTKYKLMFLS